MKHQQNRITLAGLNHRTLEPAEEYELGMQLVEWRDISSPGDPYQAKWAIKPDELAELSDTALIAYNRALKARDTLLRHNLKTAAFFSQKLFVGQASYPADEKFTVGMTGLIRAVELFDPRKGRLSTTVGLWVKQVIDRHNQKFWHSVAISQHASAKVAKTLQAEQGYPDEAKLAEIWGVDGKLTELTRLTMALAMRAAHPVRLDGLVKGTDNATESIIAGGDDAWASIEADDIVERMPAVIGDDAAKALKTFYLDRQDNGKRHTQVTAAKAVGLQRKKFRSVHDRSIDALRRYFSAGITHL